MPLFETLQSLALTGTIATILATPQVRGEELLSGQVTVHQDSSRHRRRHRSGGHASRNNKRSASASGSGAAASCSRRRRYPYGKSLVYRGRPRVSLVRGASVRANDGSTRWFEEGDEFYSGGCDSKGTCVIYSDDPEALNPNGTTFFGYVPNRLIREKDKKTGEFTRLVRRSRGAIPLANYNRACVRKRTISPHTVPTNIVHGPFGSPMWEYTTLANGRYVSGAETPASYYRNGKKLGTGYTTGFFPAGSKFYDVNGTPVTTPIRYWEDQVAHPGPDGTGSAKWVLGYVKDNGAKVWTWMLDSMSIGGNTYPGNLSA